MFFDPGHSLRFEVEITRRAASALDVVGTIIRFADGQGRFVMHVSPQKSGRIV